MVCAVCNRESNNKRVCPYCFTPYPPEAPKGRSTTAVPRQTTATKVPAEPAGEGPVAAITALVMKQSPIVRWSGLGIIILSLIWITTSGDQPDLEPGSVPSNIIASEMMREEAIALMQRTRETALVETQSDEVSVSFPAATWPQEREGQIALAQQFARADEIIEGKKRRIVFHDPSGRVFARADGVTGVRIEK